MASHVNVVSKPLSPIKKCISLRMNRPLTVRSVSSVRCRSSESARFNHVSATNTTLEQLLLAQHVASCRHHGYRIGTTIARRPHLQVRLGEVTEEKLKSDRTVAAIVHRMSDAQCAVKIIEKKKAPENYYHKYLQRELKVLRKVRGHPNVIQLFDCFESTDYIYMVLEYCELGTLDGHVMSMRGKHGRQGLQETTAKVIFGQLCNALSYCHNNGVVHRNLKSKSVMLDSHHNVKLADFCLAKMLQTFSWRALLVHPICSNCIQYSAPEMFYTRRYDGTRADIWSLGIILFFMVEGRLPFNDNDMDNMHESMLLQGFLFSPSVSYEVRLLIRSILHWNPIRRPTLAETLQDAWVQNIGLTAGERLFREQRQKRTAASRLGPVPLIFPYVLGPRHLCSAEYFQRKQCTTVRLSGATSEKGLLKSKLPHHELSRLHNKVKRASVFNSLPPAITTSERIMSSKAVQASNCFDEMSGEEVMLVSGCHRKQGHRMPALETSSPRRIAPAISAKIATSSTEKETPLPTPKRHEVCLTANSQKQPDDDYTTANRAGEDGLENDLLNSIRDVIASFRHDTKSRMEESDAYQVGDSAKHSDIATQTNPPNPCPTEAPPSKEKRKEEEEEGAVSHSREEPDTSPLPERDATTNWQDGSRSASGGASYSDSDSDNNDGKGTQEELQPLEEMPATELGPSRNDKSPAAEWYRKHAINVASMPGLLTDQSVYNRFVRSRAQKPSKPSKSTSQRSANTARMCVYKALKNTRKQRNTTIVSTPMTNQKPRVSCRVQLPVDQSVLGYRRSAAYAKTQIISVSGRRITSQKHSEKVSSCEELSRGDRKGAPLSVTTPAVTYREVAAENRVVSPQTCLQLNYARTDSAERPSCKTAEAIVTADNDDDGVDHNDCDNPAGRELSARGSDVMMISHVTCQRSFDAFVRTGPSHEVSSDRHSAGASSQCSKTRSTRAMLLANENRSDWNPERHACVVHNE